MGAGASGQTSVVVQPPVAPPTWQTSYRHDMPTESRNGVGCRSYDRQWCDMVPPEAASGQRTTSVVTSPTSRGFARRQNDDTDSVATPGGQCSMYPDAPPVGGCASTQRNDLYPDLIPGGEDVTETDAESAQDLRVNLPPVSCDTSKDDILAKIWTAEEYLGQLDEGDERIKKLSLAEEKEMHLPRIKELLAIRGHLQDELLRILDMMVEDDADLSGLEDFVATNTRIVQKLWELNKNARDIADGRPVVADTNSAGEASTTFNDSATSPYTSSQRHYEVSRDLEPDTSDLGGTAKVGVLSESDLKRKHDEEEANVVTRYAHEIVGLEPMTEDINHILNSHLLSMQALRDKQTREKEQIRHSLAQKRERLLRRSECKQVTTVEGQPHANQAMSKLVMVEGRGMSQTKMADQYAEGQGHNGYSRGRAAQGIDELYSALHIDGDEDRGRKEHSSRSPQGGHSEHVSRSSEKADDIFRSSVDEMKSQLENGMNENREQGFGRRNKGKGKRKRRDVGHSGVEGWMNGDTSPEDDDTAPVDGDDSKRSGMEKMEEKVDWAKHSSKHAGMDDHDIKESSQAQIEDFDGGSEEDSNVHDDEEDKPGHLSDESTKGVTTATIATGAGSEESEAIKEKDASFICRLVRERERLSDDDFADLLSKHLSDTECLRQLRHAEKQRLNDKMKSALTDRENNSSREKSEQEEDTVISQEMSKLEGKLRNRLLRKREEMDEDDVENVFRRFRNKQEKILKRKEAEKERNKEMLRQKLEKIRKQNITKTPEVDPEDKEEEELIEERTKKHRSAVRQMDDSSVRDSASSLVQEHQEDVRHIHDLRKREREMMDQRLKSRLISKKRL